MNGSKSVYFLRAAALLVATGVLGLALAIGQAEASGDEFGDGYSTDGQVGGVLTDILGASDGVAVQVGIDGDGGSITVFFVDNIAFNGSGDDIIVYTQVGAGLATATIEVSADGTTFVPLGVGDDSEGTIDIDLDALGLDFAVAVRIARADGEGLASFDVDAVEALNQIDLMDLNIVLTPPEAETPGFTEHTVAAALNDGAAVVGAQVSFLVTDGPNAGDAAAETTDDAGEASFAWVGDGGPGLDYVEAWLDINGDGVNDADEPSATAEKQWHGVTGAIELNDIDGDGLVVGDLVQVIVTDRDLDVTDAPDTVEVMVFSDSDSAGFPLTLTETGEHTGVFDGVFGLGDATDVDTMVLASVDGDGVGSEYVDALDGEGHGPVAVQATLEVGSIEEAGLVGITEEAGLKVTLCHLPGGNPGNQQTLTVGDEAYEAHSDHGDTNGECGEPVATSQEQQLESFCDRKDGEHERCADAGVTVEGGGDGDVGAEGEGDGAEAGNGDGDLAAFCAHKPDHRRCADFEGEGGGG